MFQMIDKSIPHSKGMVEAVEENLIIWKFFNICLVNLVNMYIKQRSYKGKGGFVTSRFQEQYIARHTFGGN